MILVEFKILKDPTDKLYPLREVEEHIYKADFIFELNGYIHGRKIFSESEVV